MFLMDATSGTGIDITSGLTAAATTLQTQIGEVLPIALPVGAGIVAVVIGWRLFKKFARG